MAHDFISSLDPLHFFSSPTRFWLQIGEGVQYVSENVSMHRDGDDDLWDSVSERIQRPTSKADLLFPNGHSNNNNNNTQTNNHNIHNNNVNNKNGGLTNGLGGPTIPLISRSDVLTNRPLDLDQEESTRKNETNRWLNSHFGSSSSSLNSEASPTFNKSGSAGASPLHHLQQQRLLSRSSQHNNNNLHNRQSSLSQSNLLSATGSGGIHVTMTSRESLLYSPPPPPQVPSPITPPSVSPSKYLHPNRNHSNGNGTSNLRASPSGGRHSSNSNSHSKFQQSQQPKQPRVGGKRITFGEYPTASPTPRKSHNQNSVQFVSD